MNLKIRNVFLILTSLIGYLHWGENNSAFVFQVEAELFSKLWGSPLSVLHPFVVVPLAGQILLCITLFQKQPGHALTWIGMAGIGLLYTMLLFVGFLSRNLMIIGCAAPFLLVAFFTARNLLKK